MFFRKASPFARLLILILLLSSCGGGGNAAPPSSPGPILVSLSANSVKAFQNGTPASVDVTVTRPSGTSNSVTLTVLSLPAGITTQVQSPGSDNTGKVTFTAAPAAPSGTYTITISAGDGVSNGSAALRLVVGIVAEVGATINTNAGVNGRLGEFMSTSFQPASWSDDFFTRHPEATTPLNSLASQHIRVQALERDIPQRTSDAWDFSYLDAMMVPILSVSDHSPEFQIARGPDFMYDSSGQHFLDTSYESFATYCQRLVGYYRQGSFTDDQGVGHSNPHFDPARVVTWWGLYNEPNINGFTADQYVSMYNVVVPAMQTVDPSLRVAAVELADFSNGPGQPDEAEKYLPTFVSKVTAQVDVLATHFYSSCNQKDSDQQVFDSIPWIAQSITYITSQLQTNPVLKNVPVWMTENNVNADYDKGGGMSACNPGQPFVTDQRGTSAFFAAWRPTVFSKLGQAGNRALYHWDFDADAQYGEVSQDTGGTYLSYWVDYWLQRMFPSPPGADILTLNTTESTAVEILATRRDDGTVVVMVANHAVKSPGDNNGPGDPRIVLVDVSALGSFVTTSQMTIDAKTDPAQGPASVNLAAASRIEIDLDGYGVCFLTLK
jgi:hypothetical protein